MDWIQYVILEYVTKNEIRTTEENVQRLKDYYINQGFNVFADATHLNSASRSKLLKRISCKPEEINVIWVDTPLQIAIERNELRKGTRAYVPPEQVRRMFNSFERPLFYEGFKKIYVVKNNKPMEILVDN